MGHRAGRRAAAAALAVLAVAGCAPGAADAGPTVTVLAASSLTEALPELADAFEDAHPDVRVVLSFAGSPTLVGQVQQGVAADVVVTADGETLALLGSRLAGPPAVIARNRLATVTAPGNPRGVRSVADLARPDLKVVLAAPQVPAGRAARQALADAGVEVRPVSQEPDVKAVLAKVRLGEADAGIVFATDLLAARGDVDGTPLPGVAGSYPAAVLRDAPSPDLARELVGYLGSAAAQSVLAEHGFLPP